MQPFASVAVMEMGKLPVCVGVPESVAPVNVMPVGSLPDWPKVTVPIPPVCENVWLYDVPAVPAGMDDGVTENVWQLMTSV